MYEVGHLAPSIPIRLDDAWLLDRVRSALQEISGQAIDLEGTVVKPQSVEIGGVYCQHDQSIKMPFSAQVDLQRGKWSSQVNVNWLTTWVIIDSQRPRLALKSIDDTRTPLSSMGIGRWQLPFKMSWLTSMYPILIDKINQRLALLIDDQIDQQMRTLHLTGIQRWLHPWGLAISHHPAEIAWHAQLSLGHCQLWITPYWVLTKSETPSSDVHEIRWRRVSAKEHTISQGSLHLSVLTEILHRLLHKRMTVERIKVYQASEAEEVNVEVKGKLVIHATVTCTLKLHGAQLQLIRSKYEGSSKLTHAMLTIMSSRIDQAVKDAITEANEMIMALFIDMSSSIQPHLPEGMVMKLGTSWPQAITGVADASMLNVRWLHHEGYGLVTDVRRDT